MELMNIEMLKSGLIAGAVIASVSAVAVLAIGAAVNENGTMGTAWQWAIISLVFGVLASVAYFQMRGIAGIDATGYLCLAVVSAVVLTALEFVPIYGSSSYAPHWQTYAALNFIYALGFGLMIPRLIG